MKPPSSFSRLKPPLKLVQSLGARGAEQNARDQLDSEDTAMAEAQDRAGTLEHSMSIHPSVYRGPNHGPAA